jgi:uncharacterized protein (TIGR02145 family)
MKKTILIFGLFAFLVTKSNSQTVTDYDGNIYNTVTIGTQLWMKENLKVTHYQNGDSIPNVKSNSQWIKLSTGAFCDYNNSPDTSKTYGKLYNWYAVTDPRNIAPVGWHVPTLFDWLELNQFPYDSGEENLKEVGTVHWKFPNAGATNKTGFTALPGGQRTNFGLFTDILFYGYWWHSNIDSSETIGSGGIMSYKDPTKAITGFYKITGQSVRCIRDTPSEIKKYINQGDIKTYPNPATDKINIDCANRQDLKMQVFNTVGQCVLQRELNAQTNTIDISSLTRGIYILKITSPNGTIEKKIIKE